MEKLVTGYDKNEILRKSTETNNVCVNKDINDCIAYIILLVSMYFFVVITIYSNYLYCRRFMKKLFTDVLPYGYCCCLIFC